MVNIHVTLLRPILILIAENITLNISEILVLFIPYLSLKSVDLKSQ